MHKQKLKQLNEQLRNKIAAQKALSDLLQKEDRNMTDDESTNFDSLSDEIVALEKSITQTKKLIEADLRYAASQAPKAPTGAKSPEAKAAERYSLLKAVRSQMEGKPLEGIELEMHQEAARELKASGQTLSGVGVPQMLIKTAKRAALDVATATALGDVVGTETREMLPALAPMLKVEEAGAEVMAGLIGNLDLPVGDDIADAQWKAEHGEEYETNITVRNVELRPNRLTAFKPVSKQLLIQTSNSVETYLRNQLSGAIGRAVDMAAFNGTGSGQPLGILNADDVNIINLGANGGAMTRAALVDMITQIAVDNADVENMSFIVSPEIRGQLQNLKTDDGSGLFVWPADRSNMLLSYRALVSNLMPKDLSKGSGTDLHAAVFGDFSNLILASWGGADITVDPFSHARKGLVDIVVNSFWDIGIKHGKGFSAVKDVAIS